MILFFYSDILINCNNSVFNEKEENCCYFEVRYILSMFGWLVMTPILDDIDVPKHFYLLTKRYLREY